MSATENTQVIQENDFDWTQIGLLCASYRKLLNLNQQDIGDMIGLGRASIANFEGGRQHLPIQKLRMLCRALGMSCEMFIERGSIMNGWALVDLKTNNPVNISPSKELLAQYAQSQNLGDTEEEMLENGYWISAIMWTAPDSAERRSMLQNHEEAAA